MTGSRWLVALAVVLVLGIPELSSAQPDIGYLTPGGNDYVYKLRIRDSDGSKSTLLSKGAIGRPGFSSDGTMIAFTLAVGDGDLGRYFIYTANTDGSNMTQLTSPAGGDFDPVWSPDDGKIAYSRDTVGSMVSTTCCEIWIMDSDGTGEKRVPNTVGGVNPTWSPNGKKLAYEAPDGVYTIKLDGSKKDRVGPNGREPAWAPSGDRIAYVRSSSNNPPEDELVVVRLSDEDKTVWYDSPWHLESPQWIGSSISVASYEGYGYADRTKAKIRLVKESGDRSIIFKGNKKMIFGIRPPTMCRGTSHKHSSGTSGVLGEDNPADCFGTAVAAGDFDNDGYDDVAVGNPGEKGAGAVHVLYGSAPGLSLAGQQRITQATASVKGKSEYDDQYGRSLAAGDFDGDGYDDLAVGVPGEDSGTKIDSGSVAVFYGSASGLSTAGDQRFTQSTSGIPSRSEEGDLMGASLTAGDYDGDGLDDLAIGVPGEGIQGNDRAGAVIIIEGSNSGLDPGTGIHIHADRGGIPGAVEAHDSFGWALSSGDFDNDGRDDLAIGVPGEDEGSVRDVGAVVVVEGRSGGLSLGASQLITQNSPGLKGKGEKNDRYGSALAAGRIDGDNRDDLVIGAPGESIGGKPGSGEIGVVFGSVSGLTAERDKRYHQDKPGIKGGAEKFDGFGAALVVGDFDGDGYGDIGIGVPGEGASGQHDAGRVAVLYGTANGVTKKGNQRFGQNTSGINGMDQRSDRFGFSLAVAQIEAGPQFDLIVGIPGEDRGGSPDSGSIVAIYGQPGGLSGQGADRYSQGG